MPPSLRWRLRASGALLAAALAVLGTPSSLDAAAGDVYAEGIEWCASTYPGHGTLSGYGPALDLNGKGGVNDLGWPVYAPEDGHVSIYSEGYGSGWGNSIIWKSADGTEKIHMAHLDEFGETGNVAAADLIGRVGKTGEASGPHLHVSARMDGQPARVELGGRRLDAGKCYVSHGPIPPKCMGRPGTLYGDVGADVLVGTAGDDVILGMGGNDVIRGRGGHDVICGGGGTDLLLGKQGEDLLRGDDGGDELEGGGGADRLKGWRGPDTLVGRKGPDRLFGQAGLDVLDGSAGADRLSGGPDRDTASYAESPDGVEVLLRQGKATGNGADVLIRIEAARGSSYDDVLAGDGGRNRLVGRQGDDLLKGREGDDRLKGKQGDDRLNGGHGEDTCTGGEEVLACEP